MSQGLQLRVRRLSRLPGMKRLIASLPTSMATEKRTRIMKQEGSQAQLKQQS